MSQTELRVRCAPSNTGPDIHAGNCRTFLFNWLFAKKNKGSMVLRIEDSDLARSKDEYADAIFDSLVWLGITPTEGYRCKNQDFGPYKQTLKLNRYKQVAEELIEKGLAYRCYCTVEELDVIRNKLPKEQQVRFRYPGICRDRKEQPNNKDYVVRFKAPTEGNVEWTDTVFGKMSMPNVENYDWILVRSNGVPTYNFGCCVDDFDQRINYVIRGMDHLSTNTASQILFHKALNNPVEIKYCHLSMIRAQDSSKLSKRHGACSIGDFRKMGYSPTAILNYIVRLGWGNGDKEIFSLDEMIDQFDLTVCKKNDSKFDPKKFAVTNYEHLKSKNLTSDNEYAFHTLPFLKERGIETSVEHVEKIVYTVRDKAKNLNEAAEKLDLFFRSDRIIEKGAEKFVTLDNVTKISSLGSALKDVNTWDEGSLRTTTQKWLAENNVALKDVGQTIRVLLSGKTVTPELFQMMSALGKEESLKRLSFNVSGN